MCRLTGVPFASIPYAEKNSPMKKLLCAAFVMLAATTADAQSFYVGAHIGEAVADDPPSLVIGTPESDQGWRIHAGWQFAEQWSVEASYHDLGTVLATFRPCPGPCVPYIFVEREYQTDAWSVRMAWRLGDQRWQPFATAGWTWSHNDGRVSGLGSGVRVGFSDKDDGFSAEIGMRVRIGDAFALRAGYEWFDLELAGEGAFNIGGEYFF